MGILINRSMYDFVNQCFFRKCKKYFVSFKKRYIFAPLKTTV